MTASVVSEDLDTYRLRAREWLAANMPKQQVVEELVAEGDDDEQWLRARELQAILFKGGFAGICYPREYGGQGLAPEYQKVFTEESAGYEMPILLNVPTLSICAPVILDMGSEEQKLEYLPKVLSGEIVLVQFLSEPSGGSDLAGLITRAERDGDVFMLNGAKTWSTSAYAADYGLCLARTDSTVPKHRGLTMFLLKTDLPGITMRRITQVNGSTEFCEEFFDDVVVPASQVVGEVNNGWAVASRQLFWERTAVGGGSPYVSGSGNRNAAEGELDLIGVAEETGQLADVRVLELIGESYAMHEVQDNLIARVTAAITADQLPGPAASIIRLFHAETDQRDDDIGLAIAGGAAVTGKVGVRGPGEMGTRYLMRQGASLGGGSTEMSRNIISERVLGMPREYAADRDVPFNQVKRSR
ncbi:MAG: acyl-CoA dehydrogenase [Frankiales bacterium]|nr:acyl-CoA dehydrogenase [Frankiales bacterium]